MSFDQALAQLISGFNSKLAPQVIQYVIAISPIILALILGKVFWSLWVRYVKLSYFIKTKFCVLEIRLPKDTFKSPMAMEAVLHSLHNTADTGKWNQFWEGEGRPIYSLELVSVEGNVKFMAWLEDRRKAGFMSALYGQFPGIEIYEREDYTKGMVFDPDKIRIWAADFVFTKPDPYPIKTYVDYGLDKDPKEEFKVDPMVPVLEFLGNVGMNQQIWMQIVIRAHKAEQKKKGFLFKKTDRWKDEAKDEINKILIRDPKTKVAGELNPDTGYAKLPTISKGEQEIVAALERSITKLPFDVGIRCLYISAKDNFDGPFGIGGIISSWKQYTTEHLNGFRPNGDLWHAQFDGVPWEDFRNMRRNYQSRMVLKGYKRRAFFSPPFKGKLMVLNTEELATIYHFPGSVAATPTLTRVPSKKAEAPANLPV